MGIVAYKDIHIKEDICKTVWENKKWRMLAQKQENTHTKICLVNLINGLQNFFSVRFCLIWENLILILQAELKDKC